MIDKNKKYQLRCGWPVEVYKTNGLGSHPVHGAYLAPSGESRVAQWTSVGGFVNDGSVREYDLIEVKPRIVQERWVNVYPDDNFSYNKTREEADRVALRNRIACVKIIIDCEHGEGL